MLDVTLGYLVYRAAAGLIWISLWVSLFMLYGYIRSLMGHTKRKHFENRVLQDCSYINQERINSWSKEWYV